MAGEQHTSNNIFISETNGTKVRRGFKVVHTSYDMATQTTEEWFKGRCECGAHKTYAGYPNLEYLHSDWCPLYLDPNWLDKINKQEKESKGE